MQDGVWEKIKEKQEELESDNSEDVSDKNLYSYFYTQIYRGKLHALMTPLRAKKNHRRKHHRKLRHLK